MSKQHILIVEDDIDLRETLEEYFKEKNYEVIVFSDATKALEFFSEQKAPPDIDLIISDIRMPGIDGLDFIVEVKKYVHDTPIIIMTAHQSIEGAVEAIKRGAYDFVTKPFKLDHFELIIKRALKLREIHKEIHTYKTVLKPSDSFHGVIGKSSAIKEVFSLVEKVAPSSAAVLITGESGTGKEVVARLIHKLSPRASKNFVAINCAAIPEALLESELFGHAKGAFTNAIGKKIGLFEEAHEGTLFLDEIGDMPLILQSKLLRTLQEKVVRRVGENVDIPIDVRIIAATHEDIAHDVEGKKFRQDLFFRLNVIPLYIPPLRERKDDVYALSKYFLDKIAIRYETKAKSISNDALEYLINQPWPGNVRELENLLERVFLLGKDSACINLEDFQTSSPVMQSTQSRNEDSANTFNFESMDKSLDEMANAYTYHVFNSVGGVKEKAARILQVDRKTLSRRLKQYEESVSEVSPSSHGSETSMAENSLQN